MKNSKTFSIIVFVIFAVITLILFFFLAKVHMESAESFVPADNPYLMAMKRMEKEFGDSSEIMIIVKTPGLFKEKNSIALYNLVQKIKKIQAVKSVQSIFDAADVKYSLFGGMKYTPYFKNGVSTSAASQMLNSKLYVGNLVDSQGKVTSIIVYLKNQSKNITAALEKLLKNSLPKDMKYYMTGDEVVDSFMNSSIIVLAIFYPPFLFGLMWLLYFLRIGNIVGAAIPPLLSAMAAMWTYGIAGMFGIPLNMINATVGIFIIVVSSSYGLHFLDRYMFNRSKFNHDEAILKTLKEETLPIIMSALTTIVGFISFVFTGIGAFKTFGILVSIGIGISMLFAIILIPAIAEFFDIHKKSIPTLKFKVSFSRKFNLYAIVVTLVLVAISPLFMTWINVNSDEFEYFKYNSNVRASARAAKEYFGWVLPFYVMVEKSQPFTTQDTEKLEKLITDIEKIQGVSGINSVLDISKSFNIPLPILQTLSRNPKYASYFSEWFYSNTTRLFVKTFLTDTNSAQRIAHAIESLKKNFPQYKIEITSPSLIYSVMNSSVMQNQISTIVMAFIFILILLIITFRSIIPPLIASIPIVLTVVFNFAFMGIAKVNLEVSTAITSSVLMGLIIDYSIHTISRYRMTKNVDEVINEVGPVILISAFGLIAGFATLLFAPLRLYMQLGLLLMVGIAVGAFLTIIFVGELLRMYDKSKKRKAEKK
jgi:predicted RND superfamily exporter protein